MLEERCMFFSQYLRPAILCFVSVKRAESTYAQVQVYRWRGEGDGKQEPHQTTVGGYGREETKGADCKPRATH